MRKYSRELYHFNKNHDPSNGQFSRGHGGGGGATPTRKKITPGENVSAVTKRVINDHNTLSDAEFHAKYHVSKKTYRKRVKKYGDPYMHTKNSALYKSLKKAQPATSKLSKPMQKTVVNNIKRSQVDKGKAYVERNK